MKARLLALRLCLSFCITCNDFVRLMREIACVMNARNTNERNYVPDLDERDVRVDLHVTRV